MCPHKNYYKQHEKEEQNTDLTVIESPEIEPVSLEEAKEHLRVHHDMEDDLIENNLIPAAREYCEGFQNLSYYTQKLIYTLDVDPDGIIELPRPPLQEIEAVEFKNKDGDIIKVQDYFVDENSSRILVDDWPKEEKYPMGAYRITYLAGYDEIDKVSKKVKQAMKLLIGHWYIHREQVVADAGAIPYEVQKAVDSLLWQDRNYKA
ncbi:head-tail connector protein [Natroniella acetigena]|uniref:head-tail connector protein n=1 Tax=Natroniella acetigena TaxID=52004 RepID=UPI00200B5146|nr:head-tail connector protein [Natroniella acetigena]MCK8826403.1 head-tail connector protein [Natroniella acetigena]